MNRRAFLATAGFATTAGCLSDGEPINTQVESPTETQSPTETVTEPTATSTPAGEAEIAMGGGELLVEQGFVTSVAVQVGVVNEGDGRSGQIALTAEWYNAAGDFIDSSEQTMVSLAAGEEWLARIPYVGTRGDEIDDYELSGRFGDTPPSVPDGVELSDTRINIHNEEIQITGRVENGTGSELTYIEAYGKLYDEFDQVLLSKFVNQNGIPAGETWAFEIPYLLSDRWEQVSNYEVVLSGAF